MGEGIAERIADPSHSIREPIPAEGKLWAGVRHPEPMNLQGDFLLSIDLEDVRDCVPNGHRLPERVPEVTERVLTLLRDAGVRITFFVTGPVAIRYKTLVSEIFHEGHELACHTCAHKALDHYTRVEFEDDLKRNIEVLTAAGATAIVGFRAPTMSMTERTAWVYELLNQQGISYSSSVLPASNPLYGWPDFGRSAKVVEGVLEIPVSVAWVFGMTLPFASGIYFRALPYPVVRRQFRATIARGNPVVCYVHPYDFDQDQERIMPEGIDDNPLYRFLMFYNRSGALSKLRKLLAEGVCTTTYREFAARVWANKKASPNAQVPL